MLFGLGQRIAQLRPDAFTAAAIVTGYAVASLLIGYVIALGQPVPIALAFGVVAGIALLNALPLVIWTILAGVLLISGPVVMFVPSLEKVGWLFSLLGFFLAGAAILHSALGRHRSSSPLPTFVGFAILLFAFGTLSLTYSGGPMMEGVSAAKRYFQYFGLLFILAVVPFAPRLVSRWWHFLAFVVVLQFPFALFQRIVLVPAREGMPGVDAIDIVVGTLEGSLIGGGSSSVMALLLVSAFVYLLAAYREGIMPMRRFALFSAAVLAPLPLGEVKLLVVLLPLAITLAYLDEVRRRPFRFVMGVILALAVLAALGWSYLAINAAPGRSVSPGGDSIERIIEATIAYNFGSVGYFGTGLNRTSVYPYWFEHHQLSDPVSFLFGHGLGSSYEVRGSGMGHMSQEHPWMHIGLTAASSVLWDLGLLGFVLIIALYLSAARCAAVLVRSARPGFDRAFCRTLQVTAVMLTAMLFFSDAPITVPSQQVLTALNFGLIAWRWRNNRPTFGAAEPLRAA
jgi:hypothetical protein